MLLACVLYFCVRKVKMHIHSNNKVERIYNVIGTLRGAVEPGNLVICSANMDWAILWCQILLCALGM